MTKYVPIIAVDFDGVIHSYTSGWKGAHNIPDKPTDGAIRWLYSAVQLDTVKIVIFSSRARTWRGRRAMKQWLYKHGKHLYFPDAFDNGIRDIPITDKKPSAVVTIDDRGWRFEGKFPTIDTLLSMQPWYKVREVV